MLDIYILLGTPAETGTSDGNVQTDKPSVYYGPFNLRRRPQRKRLSGAESLIEKNVFIQLFLASMLMEFF